MNASGLFKIDDRQSDLPPAGGFLSSSWPTHETDEIEAVVRVLESGKVNSLVHGAETDAFEEEFRSFIGMPHAIAVSNGTVAIELALRALDIGQGDEVIIPARSFFATASAVVAAGAQPVFADVESDTQNIDPTSVARMISTRSRAIICVHLAGQPCDMAALQALCAEHELFLIEDCAQAHGARWDGRCVGSFGDASCFSFCTDKIMSTGGEGGMVLLRDKNVWRRAWAYKDHGKDPINLRKPSDMPPGEFRFCHESFGSNFRLTEMQSAIGRVQLRKLPAWLQKRRRNAMALIEEATRHPAILPMRAPALAEGAYYKCYLRLDTGKLPNHIDRSTILAILMEDGIVCGSGSCPDMSLETAFCSKAVRRDGELPQAREIASTTMMFQADHTLTEEHSRSVGRRIFEIMSALVPVS